MENLKNNLHQIKTTKLGIIRIKRNLNLEVNDVVEYLKQIINLSNDISKKGKNYYISNDEIIITLNASSYAIITAHKKKIKKGTNDI